MSDRGLDFIKLIFCKCFSDSSEIDQGDFNIKRNENINTSNGLNNIKYNENGSNVFQNPLKKKSKENMKKAK